MLDANDHCVLDNITRHGVPPKGHSADWHHTYRSYLFQRAPAIEDALRNRGDDRDADLVKNWFDKADIQEDLRMKSFGPVGDLGMINSENLEECKEHIRKTYKERTSA